jgi:hypothetical protein
MVIEKAHDWPGEWSWHAGGTCMAFVQEAIALLTR